MRVNVLPNAADLKRLNKTLGTLADGKTLKRELSSGLRSDLRPVVRAVQSAYGAGRLRTPLGKATRAEVRLAGKMAGARVRVDGRKMPEGLGSIPAMAEGRKPWRHPVYGNRNVWVSQQPLDVFDRTVEPFAGQLRLKALEQVNQTIRKAGGSS